MLHPVLFTVLSESEPPHDYVVSQCAAYRRYRLLNNEKGKMYCRYSITGDHSKQHQISLVKIAKYIGFCLYRRSY